MSANLTHYASRQKTPPVHFKPSHLRSFSSSIQQSKPNNSKTPYHKTLHSSSYASLLQRFKELKPLQQVHAHITTSGFSNNIFLSNRLMYSYTSVGLLTDAELIFDRISCKNIVSWTILISGFVQNNIFSKGFGVFCKMKMSGFIPNVVTITSVLPAFAKLGLVKFGKVIHSFLIRNGVKLNIFVESALVDMYGKFGLLGFARKLFDMMPKKNVVTWNGIISGYSSNGFGEEAIWLYVLMQRNGFKPDWITVMSLLTACSTIRCLRVGGLIHSCIFKSGFEKDMVIQTALMDMYVKCRCVEDAYWIFNNEVPVKDVITWTLMLSGFSDVGYGNKAMEILNQMMRLDDISLDPVCLTAMCSSCSQTGALQQGKRVHAFAFKTGFEGNVMVGTSLIDMYANCGSLGSAKRLFERIAAKDVVCWNAMISAYGMNRYGGDAIELFSQMKGSGITPDESTLVCLLGACSHAGMLDQGISLFSLMSEDYHIVPNLEHYTCMVDLLGQAGRLNDAYWLINDMPLEPDVAIYGVLLRACSVHRSTELGLKVSHKVLELDPDDAGLYVLLGDMCAAAGYWDGLRKIRVALRSKRLKKIRDTSSTEIDGQVHTFMAEDKNNISTTLKLL